MVGGNRTPAHRGLGTSQKRGSKTIGARGWEEPEQSSASLTRKNHCLCERRAAMAAWTGPSVAWDVFPTPH